MILFLLIVVAAQLTDSTFTSYKQFSYHNNIGIPAAKKRLEGERRIVEGNGGINSRIIGGWTANHDNYPWLAGLLVHMSINVSICGGSLINPTRVLTAGHCWYDFDMKWMPEMMEVVLGSNFLFYGGTRIITTRVALHPQWHPGANNEVDAGLVILPKSIIYNTKIQPILLPGNYLGETFEGWDVWAAGYGAIEDTPIEVLAQYNQAIKLKVTNSSVCVPNNYIMCTSGEGNKGICSGDSGGPLSIYENDINVLVGILMATMQSDCEEGHPSLHVRVNNILNWIYRN